MKGVSRSGTCFNMQNFIIIPILVCPILWACMYDADDFPQHEDEYWKDAECVDQKKYDECVDYYHSVPVSQGLSVSSYCKEQATYRCLDRKSSSSKKKW